MRNIVIFMAFLLFLGSHESYGSHLGGGEVTWECVKTGPNAGRFIFTVKLYRDCNGITAPPNVNLTTNAPGYAGGIFCAQVTNTDISPTGPGCPTCAVPNGASNAVQEVIYRSAAINITGVPPATGWFFYYDDCCRNNLITNLTAPSGQSFTLRAIMYPYNATNTNPCYDSSPVFAEKPQLATCTRNLTSYNANALDLELDSLVYSWGNPICSGGWPGTTCGYTPGYSTTSPLPSPTQNPLNVAAVLDPLTGVTTFTSFTQGAFVTVTKVTAYKCGIKVAEVFREIQIALIGCLISNGPPQTFNTPPIVTDNLTGLNITNFRDTVMAGDTFELTFIATDFEVLPTPPNPVNTPQSLTYTGTGVQFGTNFTSTTTGCPFPPCATLNPPPGPSVPLFTSSTFRWITDCNHLPKQIGCITASNTYSFVIKVFDNFCPSPAVNFNTLSITVVAPPEMDAARPRCLDVASNGTVQLTYQPPVGGLDTNKFFKAFYIYRSLTGPAGPFVLLDSMKGFSVTNFDTVLTYIDATVNANTNSTPISYYIQTKSGCDLFPRPLSDTLSTIKLDVNQVGTDAQLNWTPLSTPLPSSSTGKYYVFREQPPLGSNNWVLIDSTTALTYLDPVFVCNDTIRYRVEVWDTSAANCKSKSTIDGDSLQIAIPNITSPSLRCASVLSNGSVQLNWVGSVDTAGFFGGYNIYHATNLAGPYAQIGTVSNYGVNTFTHIGANGQNQINYYYLTLEAGCDATSTNETTNNPSDTLASMLLTTNNATIGFADLSWTTLSTPLPPFSLGIYKIFRRIAPAVVWTQIGTTANTTYRDTIILCDTLIDYRIEIEDASGCVSSSSIDSDRFTSVGDIIDHPSLRCLAVQANGDIQLTWQAPADPNNFFAAYQVFHSSALSGPYTQIATINNYATTTYTHVGAGGNTAPQYYYLKTLSGCDGLQTDPGSGDTLASMFLTVNNASIGFADLTWNAMRNPVLTTSPGPYRVFRRSTGIGAYIQIGSTNNLTYRDTISTCNIPYEYRIERDDNLPCTSISSADNDVFTWLGNIIPDPTLRCVSVLPNGNIQLTWENPGGVLTNFNEYEIWRNSGAGFILIDSIPNSALNTYTDIVANGNAQSHSYYLITQSGCTGQQSDGTNGNTLNSIFLTAAGVLGQANLSWTPLSAPLPATSTTGQYDVFSTYNLAGTLQQFGDTALLLYFQPINDCDTLISHQVSVSDNLGCISRSNITTNNYTYIGNIVNNPDLRCVNVLPNGQIELTWITPTGSNDEFNEFEIFRNDGSGFVLYDSISNFSQTTWTDAAANGNAQSYAYYIRSQSGCTGQVDNGTTSATLNSIYLTTSNATLGQALLNWNAMPLLPSSAAAGYDVFSSYPTGVALTNILSTLNTNANEIISDCDTTLLHRITVADASGCASNSNIDTNTFSWIGNIVNNPDLRCVNVLPNGQIELTWITPTGSNDEFNEFEIFRNDGSGFVLYDSISNFSQTTWTDAAANGNAQSYAYYIRSQSGCTGQVDNGTTSATLNSIYLTATPVLGQANLSWNALASPLPGTVSSGQYDVWSTYNSTGSLSIFGDTAQLVYFQTILNCDTTLSHQISAADNSGCVSSSNITTDDYTYLGNIIDNPELRCANVLPNGQVQLTWVNPSPASWTDYNQYNLYRSTGGAFTLIDSIENNTQSTYLDANANGNAGSVSYYLQTRSGCTGQENPSASGGSVNGNTMTTIFLTVGGFNTTTAQLNWNAPSTPLLATSVGSYLIEKEYPINSGSWSVAGNTTLTSFQDNLVLCIDSVKYRVSIGDAVGCLSTSNVNGNLFVDHTIPDAPEPRCVSVQANGNVDLNWIAPQDTGQRFRCYIIYRSASGGGPFTAIDTLFNYNTLSYTDVAINAQTTQYFYYLTTQTDCGREISSPSITASTIKTDVLNNNGVAVITWNPIINPELPTATLNYQISREYPVGIWNVIGNTTAPNYQWFDTINVCSAVINYLVETGDQSGCISRSSIDGDLFRDITRPAAPLLDTVSLDPQNPSQVSISWLPSTSGDVVGYIIYQFNGASWDSIGGVAGINGSYFLHNNPAAAFGPQLYTLASYDSCRNVSNLGVSHNTLYLTAELDICRAAIDLRWNPYINMVNQVGTYHIYVSENNGPYSLLASVPPNNITYSHTGLKKDSEYCYFVQAQGNTISRTASSNATCIIANLLTEPTFSYLKRATVIDQQRVKVFALVDTVGSPDVSKYKLQRSFEKNGPWTTITAINYTGNPIVEFDDFSARTNQYSYYYRVITLDSCGNEVLISNLGRTILLSGRPEFNLVNKLTWNFYEEWLGSVKEYGIFRSVDGVWEPLPVNINPTGILDYNDNVAELYKYPNYKGQFCYRIEAYEGPGNTYGFTDTSVSNIFCLVQEPHLFIPSAFTPGGKNTIFKPEFIYIKPQNFFFAVFNRWGQKVYETRMPGEGWDGTYNGSVAPEGTYVYTVRIFGTNGQEIEKNGTVTLLR